MPRLHTRLHDGELDLAITYDHEALPDLAPPDLRARAPLRRPLPGDAAPRAPPGEERRRASACPSSRRRPGSVAAPSSAWFRILRHVLPRSGVRPERRAHVGRLPRAAGLRGRQPRGRGGPGPGRHPGRTAGRGEGPPCAGSRAPDLGGPGQRRLPVARRPDHGRHPRHDDPQAGQLRRGTTSAAKRSSWATGSPIGQMNTESTPASAYRRAAPRSAQRRRSGPGRRAGPGRAGACPPGPPAAPGPRPCCRSGRSTPWPGPSGRLLRATRGPQRDVQHLPAGGDLLRVSCCTPTPASRPRGGRPAAAPPRSPSCRPRSGRASWAPARVRRSRSARSGARRSASSKRGHRSSNGSPTMS